MNFRSKSNVYIFSCTLCMPCCPCGRYRQLFSTCWQFESR